MKNWKALLALGLVVGCTDEGVTTEEQAIASRYIVSCANALPATFSGKVAARGDSLGHFYPAAGFATVTTSSPNAYANASCLVAPDVRTRWIAPLQTRAVPHGINPPNTNDDDFFFDLQWGHDAVNAPEAWVAGRRGQGVRVAVLDTGFNTTHPDLAGQFDVAASADFTGQGLEWTSPPLEDGFPNVFSHGTHTAGTIAGADNGFGIIGVAPDAKLILVKVLFDEGWGDLGAIFAGMIHATNVDADIISMSLGATFPRNDAAAFNRYFTIYSRIAQYAHQRGTTVIAAVGNDNQNLDGNWATFPAAAANVIGVSATAPHDIALNPGSSLDHRAGYSNFGSSTVDLAGPGGDVYREPNFEQVCTVGFITDLCFVFDLVISSGGNFPTELGPQPVWFWAAGTSMATPHVAGVAALILSEGPKTPAQLDQALRSRATDLGQPGKDPVYGHGRVSSGY